MSLLFPVKLLFKPLTLVLKPVKIVYWLAGLVAFAGILVGVWTQSIDLFGSSVFFAFVWSVIYSFLYA